MWRTLFVGRRGLRAGWRLGIFIAVTIAVVLIARWASSGLPAESTSGWTPGLFVLSEAVSLVAAWIVTAIMCRIERRSFPVYGLPVRGFLGRHFWEGSLWGLLAVVALVGLIGLCGGLTISGLARTGGALFTSAALWLLAMLLLGLFEELYFRGYPLYTLSTGIGFWPASLLLSAAFGALHFFGKPMENAVDGASVSLIALFLCLTLRRTGTLWFAVGFHFMFDYAALVLFGAPNTGNGGRSIADHLLGVRYTGPDWLTGGPRGLEASAMVFVVIALLFAAFHFRHRTARYPLPE
ncbi:MAG TPA: type II CAAX endopeptidase family protein [Candidatus Eisenbacteria bacterium]|jgi:hypothetical protein